MSITLIVALALGLLAAGEGVALGVLVTRETPADLAEQVQAPALTEAQMALAVAQWPALQVATAAAMSDNPPRCALELAALLAVVQGGQQGQGFGALDSTGISQQYQVCRGGRAMKRLLPFALLLCLPALVAADAIAQAVSPMLMATGDPALGVAARVAEHPSSLSWPLAAVLGVWIISREIRRGMVEVGKRFEAGCSKLAGWQPVVTLRQVQAEDTAPHRFPDEPTGSRKLHAVP